MDLVLSLCWFGSLLWDHWWGGEGESPHDTGEPPAPRRKKKKKKKKSVLHSMDFNKCIMIYIHLS